MRKKVDSRIRTLVENCVKLGQRSLFVIVGDKGRDQVRPVARLPSCLPARPPARLHACCMPGTAVVDTTPQVLHAAAALNQTYFT